VGEHIVWAKSSYFLAYSLLGQIAPPTRQLHWLDLYYTGCCLLLCWQYYRLARAVGLGERASMLFVILQTVLFGNNVFGFYRYYGISSSIFAQIGAVALTRVAIEAARGEWRMETGDRNESPASGLPPVAFRLSAFLRPPFSLRLLPPSSLLPAAASSVLPSPFSVFLRAVLAALSTFFRLKKSARPAAHGAIACEQAPTVSRIPAFPHFRFSSALPSPFSVLLRAALAALALLALIAFNHVQGLGIAALGLGAVAVWRLIEWRRSTIWWLAAGALVLSIIAVLWFPRDPAIDQLHRRDGWFTAWFGLKVFAFSLPVGDRTLQILGLFGLINLAAGLFLLRRNHVVGWLTITPLIALSLPFIAIPFASALAQHGGPVNIVTFQRMLFEIPSGLALVALGAQWWQGARSKEQGTRTEVSQEETEPKKSNQESGVWSFAGFSVSRFSAFPHFRFSSALPSPFSFLLLALAALVLIPANGPCYNRFWQALMVPPDDLTMKPIVLSADSAAVRPRSAKHPKLVATAAVASVFAAIAPRQFPSSERQIAQPIVESLKDAVAVSLSNRPTMNSKSPTLTRDPLAAVPSAWIRVGGLSPEFGVEIKDFSAGGTALQNPPGQLSEVLTSDLIPIDPTQVYWVEWSVRQRVGTEGTTFLAVAWYDAKGRLLESNIPGPVGADRPAGWNNGTYSYFGLNGTATPPEWTTYRTSFGPNEAAAIPSDAGFVKVGALLNYSETPGATIQLTNVRLWRKSRMDNVAIGVFPSDERLLVVAPSSQILWTYASQAGWASTHWPAQEAAAALAGGAELAAASRAAGGTQIDSAGAIFELQGNGGSPAPNQ